MYNGICHVQNPIHIRQIFRLSFKTNYSKNFKQDAKESCIYNLNVDSMVNKTWISNLKCTFGSIKWTKKIYYFFYNFLFLDPDIQIQASKDYIAKSTFEKNVCKSRWY